MATYLISLVCTPPKKIFVAPQLLPTHHQIAFQPCYFLQHLPLFLRNLKFQIFVKIVTKGEFAIYFTVFCLCNRHFFRVHPLSPIKLSSFWENSQLHCDSRLSSSLSTIESNNSGVESALHEPQMVKRVFSGRYAMPVFNSITLLFMFSMSLFVVLSFVLVSIS